MIACSFSGLFFFYRRYTIFCFLPCFPSWIKPWSFCCLTHFVFHPTDFPAGSELVCLAVFLFLAKPLMELLLLLAVSLRCFLFLSQQMAAQKSGSAGGFFPC
ncbi:hypothetical protein ATANTOWER_008437 [Ataeniobius toweri]|uniref:Uncharacterized protein n=1 Tax=Ataeniobius toweri TaxID=208326 RepID=A0ABU7BY16_9TELE|nr:hypothetical protein [Ataeniobius toweri]